MVQRDNEVEFIGPYDPFAHIPPRPGKPFLGHPSRLQRRVLPLNRAEKAIGIVLGIIIMAEISILVRALQ